MSGFPSWCENSQQIYITNWPNCGKSDNFVKFSLTVSGKQTCAINF